MSRRAFGIGLMILVLVGMITAIGLTRSRSGNSTPEAGITAATAPPVATTAYRLVEARDRDYIPAIDNPDFISAAEADLGYKPDELVIGVAIDGDARAYSVPLLSRHEIVNDVVGGVPVAVTW